jgi:hypothetical protein
VFTLRFVLLDQDLRPMDGLGTTLMVASLSFPLAALLVLTLSAELYLPRRWIVGTIPLALVGLGLSVWCVLRCHRAANALPVRLPLALLGGFVSLLVLLFVFALAAAAGVISSTF